jgi:hypothetical protein
VPDPSIRFTRLRRAGDAARPGALAEVVEHGFQRLDFHFESPGCLGVALQRLAEEPDLLVRLRDGASTTKIPSLEGRVTAMRRVYSQALAMRTTFARDGDDEELMACELLDPGRNTKELCRFALEIVRDTVYRAPLRPQTNAPHRRNRVRSRMANRSATANR